jgi:hypothetical protein
LHSVGQVLCHWILPESAESISQTTVQAIPADVLDTQQFKDSLQNFDTNITERLSRGTNDILNLEYLPTRQLDVVDPDYESADISHLHPEADDFDAETYENYISAQVLLPKEDNLVSGTVMKRKRYNNGNPTGRSHNNPLLDTRVYEVSKSYCDLKEDLDASKNFMFFKATQIKWRTSIHHYNKSRRHTTTNTTTRRTS